MNRWRDIIQNCVYPPTCLLCGDAGADGLDLCRPCRDDLPPNVPACPRCGEALPADAAAGLPCGRCQTRPPAFDATVALLRFEGPVRRLVHDLKFHADLPCARLLGLLLGRHLRRLGARPDCIIPVPLHPARYRERGFNQAIEIARHVAETLDVPLNLNACVRVRATPPQSTLTAKERLRNLKHAFAVVDPPAATRVALVDDVITTGATLDALASVLKKTGIERVDAWACARA